MRHRFLALPTFSSVPNGAVPLHRFTGSSIKVLKWLVEAGEPIQRGQAVLEMETDKATAEIEAPASGWLLEQKSGNS